jgi:hypothetical protein
MNDTKEAIKLARRLYESEKTRTARALLREYGLADRYVSVGDSITRLEQEYGILDEVLTDSESERYFRDRCKSHEMRAEDCGCMDLDKKASIIAGLFLIGVLISALVLVIGLVWLIISLVL